MTRDTEVELIPTLELEAPLRIYFEKRAKVRLLSLHELVPAITTGFLTVVNHVEGVSNDATPCLAAWVARKDVFGHRVQSRVVRLSVHLPRLYTAPSRRKKLLYRELGSFIQVQPTMAEALITRSARESGSQV